MMKLGIFFLIIVMNIVAHPVCAQDVAVKTNILSDVFLNINTARHFRRGQCMDFVS